MKYLIFKVKIFFLSFLIADYNFENITVRDGLSDDQCLSISSDKSGFIWIGTNEGLNRFDGYSPKIYRSNPFDSTALSGNKIFDTFTDRDGALWISTDKSVDKYLHGSNSFKRFFTGTSPTYITEDNNENIWVATLSNGLFRINKKNNKVSNFKFSPLDPTSISSNQFIHTQNTSIIVDNNDNLWIATQNGLNFFDSKSGIFKRFYSKKNDLSTISSNIINTIYFDGQFVWVGSSKGLDKIDINNFSVSRESKKNWNSMLGLYHVNQIIPFKSGVPMNGFWIATIGGLIYYDKNMGTYQDIVHPDIFGRYVSKVYINKDGDLWLYIPQSGGIIKFKTTNFYLMYGFYDPVKDFSHIKSLIGESNSLLSDNINDIFFDSNGTSWFATNKGVSKLKSSNDVFKLNTSVSNAHSISIARDNTLWFSHDDGLTAQNNQGQEINYISNPTDANSLLTNETEKILVTNKGLIWAASKYGGVTLLDPVNNKFKRYESDNSIDNPLIHGKINTIYEDINGSIWFSSNNGISKFKNEKFHTVSFNPVLNNEYLIDINSFLHTSSDDIWIGTNSSGLYRLNYNDLSIRKHYTLDLNDKYSFSSSTVLTIFQSRSKDIWIGTGGEGLFKYDKNIDGFYRFSIDQGLPSNTIVSIVEDNEGFIWMGTRNGVSRFNPISNTFQNYNVSDGLSDRIFHFQSIGIDNYGLVYFGSPQGVHVTDPSNISKNQIAPKLSIVDIIGLDKSNKAYKYDFSNNEIDLFHHIQTLNIDYVGLSFNKSEKNNYKYKLENFNEDWIDNGTSRKVSFQGIIPGEYKFRFMSSNNDGVWSEASDPITINVYPPIWKTWWAYSGYLGLATLAFFGSVKTRDKTQAKKLEEDRRITELEEAREFQMKMLPKKFPNMLGLDIAAGIKTATEVGGDYFDFFPQSNDDSLHVVVGDATGHGMTAGMMVSITKAGLMGSPQNIPPNEISYGLNRIIKDIELGKNKMAINIAKFTEDKVEFTSAAMPPVYHYIADTGVVDELLLEGLPLGSFKGETYSLVNMKCNVGDVFVFLSDGLPEVENKGGEMLGYKAVLECIKNNGHLSSEEIKQSLLDLGEAWLDGLQNQDDITIVVIKKLK